MAEFYLTQTGEETQEALNQVMPNKDDIAAEVQARIDGDAAVTQHCEQYTYTETQRAQGVEANLQEQINEDVQARIDGDAAVTQHCNEAVAAENERALGVEANLQQQINEIVGGDATVSLTASPTPIFVGQEYSIALTASTNKNATSIIIKKSDTQIASGSGSSLQKTDTVTADATGNISYSAEFIISGVTRTASRDVKAVYPIYFGAGMEQTDVLGVDACKATARTTPNGTYNVTVADSPKYIWFFVPSGMPQITSAKMNGFDFPLETQPDATEGGVTYKVYRTPNTQEAGTYPIIINPA